MWCFPHRKSTSVTSFIPESLQLLEMVSMCRSTTCPLKLDIIEVSITPERCGCRELRPLPSLKFYTLLDFSIRLHFFSHDPVHPFTSGVITPTTETTPGCRVTPRLGESPVSSDLGLYPLFFYHFYVLVPSNTRTGKTKWVNSETYYTIHTPR